MPDPPLTVAALARHSCVLERRSLAQPVQWATPAEEAEVASLEEEWRGLEEVAEEGELDYLIASRQERPSFSCDFSHDDSNPCPACVLRTADDGHSMMSLDLLEGAADPFFPLDQILAMNLSAANKIAHLIEAFELCPHLSHLLRPIEWLRVLPGNPTSLVELNRDIELFNYPVPGPETPERRRRG